MVALSGLAFADFKTTIHASGFSLPVAIIQDPLRANVQYVVEQASGQIKIIENGVVRGTPFINIRSRISTGGERGLLGLAFSPNYESDGHFYVNYTAASGGATVIARFSRTADPNIADPNSFRQVISIPQPFSNHNGGTIAFGPIDGYLYIGMGDGGSGNDPQNHSQRTDSLLGKMLRIDPSRDDFPSDPNKNYAVPADNPFLDGLPVNALPEIWAFGVRNPWKWTFDDPVWLGSGGMTMADVGQNAFEEINFEPSLAGGRNYGWALKEGFRDTGLNRQRAFEPFKDPFHAYGRAFGQSITGGYIYRGVRLGEFFGNYIFADYVFGRVYTVPMRYDENGEALVVPESDRADITDDLSNNSLGAISSFGVDSEGELFLVNYSDGTILRVEPENTVWFTGVSRVEGGLSGNARHVLRSDDRRLMLVPVVFVRNGQSSPTEAKFDLQTDQLSRTALDIAIEASISRQTDATLEVRLRNWQTGEFDRVGAFTTGPNDQVFNLSGLPAATYRSASGQIEMRLRSFKVSFQANDLFNLLVDQVRVTLR